MERNSFQVGKDWRNQVELARGGGSCRNATENHNGPS